MKKYEVLYILSPKMEADYQANINQFESIVLSNGGSVIKSDYWGKKRLAYEINGYNDGIYVLTEFFAESVAVKELDRKLKLSEDVLRHMILRKEE